VGKRKDGTKANLTEFFFILSNYLTPIPLIVEEMLKRSIKDDE